MMIHTTIRTALLASVAGMALSPALAQDALDPANQTAPQTASPAAPHGAFVLDPVVIRAGKPKVASDVPQSVTVVGGEQLDDIDPTHIGEVLATVPGVAGSGSGSFFGQGFNIRGFGASAAGTAGAEAGIVQLIDGEKKYYDPTVRARFSSNPTSCVRSKSCAAPARPRFTALARSAA
ncbi:TonB-dependent receptor plug domain-containing protein [Paracoccus cavernae]|uniref:TonB-dependent receptor plug domain-containing protein n=1 Tax=Paracoccus cavernae TaxID=1571207 RepID=A0ABT8DAZ3_9RHOB|nr:TonB-dependent receptor plug domain-containing protein [Paracoccus cavernae]